MGFRHGITGFDINLVPDKRKAIHEQLMDQISLANVA